jgi:biopolymer transport protein ExbD
MLQHVSVTLGDMLELFLDVTGRRREVPMASPKGSVASSDINITATIDILLVLLIIFMAIAPVAPSGLKALLPRKSKDRENSGRNDRIADFA